MGAITGQVIYHFGSIAHMTYKARNLPLTSCHTTMCIHENIQILLHVYHLSTGTEEVLQRH